MDIMLTLEIKTIAEQLVDIYNTYESWHKFYMPYAEALKYHQDRLDSGDIVVYLADGEVLGYYERYIINDTCDLHNVFIKPEVRRSIVWKELYHHFFNTMPKGVTKINGTKQKIGGKFIERLITKGRKDGVN